MNEKTYDNTNSGAVFPYSASEMRGPFTLAGDVQASARITANENGTRHLVIVSDDAPDTVIAEGEFEMTNSPNARAPMARGSITFAETGEIVKMAAWHAAKNDTGEPFARLSPDSFDDKPASYLF